MINDVSRMVEAEEREEARRQQILQQQQQQQQAPQAMIAPPTPFMDREHDFEDEDVASLASSSVQVVKEKKTSKQKVAPVTKENLAVLEKATKDKVGPVWSDEEGTTNQQQQWADQDK